MPIFVYPLGAALLLGLFALSLLLRQHRRAGLGLLTITLVGLWAASTPLTAKILLGRLEARYPPAPIDTAPQVDAIILLAGIVSQPLPPRLAPDLGDAVDRVVHAIRLYRLHKASYIVVTGGNLPWQPAVAPEARLIADLLVEFGIPASSLIVESESRNTRENAVNTSAIFAARGWRTGLLVTSGAHMPRALASFQKLGLEVTPTSTDIEIAYPLVGDPFDLLPDANALSQTSRSIKEFLGFVVYRYRGWA